VKISSSVAGLLRASTILTMLTGCRQEQMQRCVDEHNVVVDDSLCANPPSQQNNSSDHPPGGIYRYYYGGTGTYYPGSVATGGGYAPRPDAIYATSRGGFSYGRGGRK
jgi:hypothetical protein